MDYTTSAPRIGIAGELRVRSELLLRGIDCAVFDFDSGVDMITSTGKRLQVKTSVCPHYRKNSYSNVYEFNIRTPQFRSKRNGGDYEKRFTRADIGSVDFVVLYCISDNLIYIVPKNSIGSNYRIAIVVPLPDDKRIYKKSWKKSESKYEQYLNAWELLK